MKPLSKNFFNRDTLKVAEDLIGSLLVYETGGKKIICRVVETEAYKENDPACHAFRVRDKYRLDPTIKHKSAELFGDPGTCYIYLNYGMYWLLNVVTEKKGIAGAVLIRAVEPLEGIEQIRKNRKKIKSDFDLTNGPGKLTVAMGIPPNLNGISLTAPPLYFCKTNESFNIQTSPRIGISQGQGLHWRFFLKGNSFVSGKKS